MAGLGAVGGVDICTQLNLEKLQRRAVSRLEQVVENLAPLRLGLVNQQSRRSTGADRSNAVKDPAWAIAIEHDAYLLAICNYSG